MPFIYVGDHDCDPPDPRQAHLGLWALWTCEECGTIWKLNPRDEWRRPFQWLARRDLRQRREADARRALLDEHDGPGLP